MAMSEIKPGLLFMVPNLGYKFQIFAQWKLQLLNDNLRNLYFSALFWAYSRTNKNDSLKLSFVCLSWPLTQLLNGNLRNLIFYGKSGCITPEQKKCKKIICARGNSHIFIIERKVNEGHTDRHGSALMTPNVGERICIPILSITADYFSYIFSKYCNVFQVTVTSKIHTIT
jgi:hypothetical protein